MPRVRNLLSVLVLFSCLLIPSIATNSASSRAIIKLDNVDQLQKVGVLGKGTLGEVRWSPDGRMLAVGSTTGIWLYDARNFQREPRWLGNRDFPATRLSFSADGKKLVSYNRLTKISVWDVASQHLEREITFENQGYVPVTNTGSGFEYSPVYDVSFTPQGQLLVTSALPNEDGFHVWNAYTGQELIVQKGVSPDISSASYSPDGKTVAFGIAHDLDMPGEVQLWSLKTGKLTSTLSGPTSPVNTVAYSQDGRYLASGSGAVPSDYADDQNDNTARLWDATTGKVLHVLTGHEFWVETIAFSVNNQLLASGSGDNTIRLWTVRDGKLKTVLKGHSGWISNVVFSPNSERLASTSGDGTVRIWDTKSGTELTKITDFSGDPSIYVGPGGGGSSFDYAFGPDNVSIGTILGGDTFKIWNGLDGKEISAPTFSGGLSAQAKLNAFMQPEIVTNWNQISRESTLKPECYFDATFSPDLKYMLIPVAHGDQYYQSVQLWALNSQKLIADLPYDPHYESLVFSPDSKSVIMMTISSRYSDFETSIIVINVATGQEAYRSTRQPFQFSGQGRVVGWRFSADGKRLGTIWNDGYISVIDLETGRLAEVMDLRPQGYIDFGQFTSNLDQVIYTQEEDTSKIVDMRTKRVWNVSGYPGRFTLDDQVVFTTSENKLLAWNVKTGQLLRTFESRGSISWIRLSPDGTMLAVANDDDVVETWAILSESF